MYKENNKIPHSTVKHVIAIAAGKGGVGKSLITVNLAFALQKLGFKVGIMDADLYGPSIQKMLPEDRLPRQDDKHIYPALSRGIRMISMAYFCKKGEASIVRAPIANGIINQFIRNVEWEELDYLLIDFPPGTGDIQLTLCQQAHLTGALLITTPQEVALLDVRKALQMFETIKIPLIGIVENMSYYFHAATNERVHLFGQGGGERLASESGLPLLGSIPLSPQLCVCADIGKSIFDANTLESQEVGNKLTCLASRVVEQVDLIKSNGYAFINNFEMIWKEMS
jgi:ATP-binding protein involved in chromosome partitioning